MAASKPTPSTSLDLQVTDSPSDEDFGTPSTDWSDAYSEGLMSTIKPLVEQLDSSVKATRLSQISLRSQIDTLAEDLRLISERYESPYELESYVKKLQDSRKRIAVVSSILHNAQERLRKLQKNIEKETAKRASVIEPPLPNAP